MVELLAVTDSAFDASVILDDAEEGPDAVRVFPLARVGAAVRHPVQPCDLSGPSALSVVRRAVGPEGHLCAYQRLSTIQPDDPDS